MKTLVAILEALEAKKTELQDEENKGFSDYDDLNLQFELH